MNVGEKHWYSWLLNPWVIFITLGIGVLIGRYLPHVAINIAFIGDIYLALLQMCIIPLIVTAITTSFAKLIHSNVQAHLVRRMIMIFLFSMLISAAIGIIFSVLGDIGSSLNESSQNHLGSLLLQSDSSATNVVVYHHSFLSNFISDNIFKAFTDGQNIPILIFAILLGLALGFVSTKAGKDTLVIFDGLFQTFLTLVNGIMYLLPIGLLALIADEVARTGFEMLSVAGELIVITYILGIALILVFMFITSRRTRIGYLKTFYHLREMLVVSFVSGSSFAALPFGIASLIKDFKLSQTKVNLFFPLSVCLNPVGTCYFLALVAVFIAHLYGQHLSGGELMLIWLLSIITALAMGAVPAVAGFSLLGMLFGPLGLPASTAIVLLIAISNILDPIITMVNVAANAASTALLSTPEETPSEELHELVSAPADN